ncbi:hypothetical protein HYFRA_00012078 [Hymenoscyphus fraxineus]|uniref:Uncharacterized protein n=1 Tax=Hymenoscyphus fraxineus TaxID=746836 RepID=A0A9N9L023_9HELO|nr:hypothetical protein HYFRA_00012078 [Hymenoscyphus fraxineus]
MPTTLSMSDRVPWPTEHQKQEHSLRKWALAGIQHCSPFPDAPKVDLREPTHRPRYPTEFRSSPLNPEPKNISASETADLEFRVPGNYLYLGNYLIHSPSDTLRRLSRYRLRRPVVLREDWKDGLDLKVMRNAEAFAITAVGEVQEGEDRCRQCRRGQGPFAICVVVSGCEKGACGCCVYGTGTKDPKCSLWFGKGFYPKRKASSHVNTRLIEDAIARGSSRKYFRNEPPLDIKDLSWDELLEQERTIQQAMDITDAKVLKRLYEDEESGYAHWTVEEQEELLATWDGLSTKLMAIKRLLTIWRLGLLNENEPNEPNAPETKSVQEGPKEETKGSGEGRGENSKMIIESKENGAQEKTAGNQHHEHSNVERKRKDSLETDDRELLGPGLPKRHKTFEW